MYTIMAPNKDNLTTDSKLEYYIERISYGSKVALADLYHATSSAVYGFALSYLKNASDAEDVLQDVYIKIYDNASMYEAKGKPLAWILTITKNLALMKLRKQKDATNIDDMLEFLVSNKEFTNENKIILNAAFKNLSDEERNILILHADSGFKHREIAKILNLPLSTVLSKYHRAIKKIKNIIKEEDMI